MSQFDPPLPRRSRRPRHRDRDRGRAPAGPRDHHRHVRRRPEHRGQRARGPRLVRRRQPAAGAAADAGRAGRPVARRRRPDGRGRRRTQPGLLRRPHRGAGPARRRRQRPADRLPGGLRRRRSCAGTRRSGGRTRCRATAGSSTASPASARCCATCAPRPTSCSTPRTSTCTSSARRCSPRSSRPSPALHATVMSFGFKYGLPVDADLVVDCRFLPNPHWVPELRPLTGRDAPVRDYVMAQAGRRRLPGRRYEQLLDVIGGRLPARGQALRHHRRRLHRRQAPLGRDGRGAGRAGSPRTASTPPSSTATSGGSDVVAPDALGRAVVALGGGHGLAASCRRCAG